MRGVVNSDISWRFNLNRKSTLNLGLFGGVDGFRNGGGSYRQGYSSSQDPLHYYIEAIYDDEDENEYTWGFQFGFSRNNWDMVLRHEFIKSEIQYRTYTIPERTSERKGIEPSEILYFAVVMNFLSFSRCRINIGLNDFMCNFLVG